MDLASHCCPEFDPVPKRVGCFLPDICAEFDRLVHRHRHMFIKRRRLLKLAEPRNTYRRFVRKCACKFKNPIEIIRLDQPVHTRTEQLAYPSVRKLLLFKETVKNLFGKRRHQVINRTIRLSLLSLYSRLQNIQPPEKRIPIHKWDKKEWNTHMKHIKKLAKHKVPPPVPKLPVKAQPLSAMKRFKKLAKPKHYEEFEKVEWSLTPEMKYYAPTERILKLSKPLIHDDEALHQPLPIQITPNALRYKASPRIKELATPPEKRAGESDLKENPFAIAPNALKARPTARITELAEPKEYENTHIRENPFAISPAALKAKCSPRLAELAKPKGS